MDKRVDFSLSLLFFWVKGFLSVDSRFVKVSLANNILGFIPAGKNDQTIPLKNVSATTISSSYKIKRIIFGLFIVFFGISGLAENALTGLILMIIGAGIFGNGILTVLVIQRAGADFLISVPFYEKSKLLKAQDMLEEALKLDTDKTDLNQFFDKKEVK
jgi:hypothetical protein